MTPNYRTNLISGLVQDNGRVWTTSGSWLRKRKSDLSRDFFPFGFESQPQKIERTSGAAYQANSTNFVPVTTTTTAYYVCERFGNFTNKQN